MGIKKLELTTKRSNFWYILPIVFGFLGGIIAYFILRKSDSKKAKICIIVGIGISALWIVWIASYETKEQSPSASRDYEGNIIDSTPELTAEPREKEIQAAREAEEARYQADLERQRKLEEARYQAGLERQRELEKISKFNPAIIKSAKENIPQLQALPKVILKNCRNVNSYSDYLVFMLAIAATEPSVPETIYGIDAALTDLEILGYDKHPEVGPLIKETRSLASETGECLDNIIRKYGS